MKRNVVFNGILRGVHRDIHGKIIDEVIGHNLVVNQGIHEILNNGLHGTMWYFAPWITNTTPTATDTYAAPVNTEATTQISESTRQEWIGDAGSGQSITNSVAAVVTAASAVTIYGFGIVGKGTAASTKGDTAGGGILVASGLFSTGKSLAVGETLSLYYTMNGSST